MNKVIKTDEDVVDFLSKFKTRQDFIDWIKDHPEKEYDTKTRTGWMVPRDNTAKIIYYKEGYLGVDPDTKITKLMLNSRDEISQVHLEETETDNQNKGDLTYKNREYRVTSGFVYIDLIQRHNATVNQFIVRAVSRTDKTKELYFRDRSYLETDETLFLSSKEKIPEGFVGTVYIMNRGTVIEEIKMEDSKKSKPQSFKPCKFDEEWVEKVFPQVETLEKFNEFIKLNGWEYNKETGTGWTTDHSNKNFIYVENHKRVIDKNLGISRINFHREGDLFKFAENDASSLDILPENANEVQLVCVEKSRINNEKEFCFNYNDLHHNKKYTRKDYILNDTSESKEETPKPSSSFKPCKLGREWIDTIFPKVSTLDKFQEFIKQNGWEYNETTQTGWEKNNNSFLYKKNGKHIVDENLGVSKFHFRDGYFDFAEINSVLDEYPNNANEEQPVCIQSLDDLGLSFEVSHNTVHYGNDSREEYIEISPKKEKEGETTLEKKAGKKQNLDNTWSEMVFPEVSTVDKFKDFIKSNKLEYNETTKTGWKQIDSVSYNYFVNNTIADCEVLGGSGITFVIGKENSFNYIKHHEPTIPDHSTKQVMYIQQQFGGTSNVLAQVTTNRSFTTSFEYEFYNLYKKKWFRASSINQAINIANQKEYNKLDVEFIEKVIPKITTLDGFKTFIKGRGEEYDDATKTGWKEFGDSSSFEYFEKGKSVISSFGCNVVKFNGEKKLMSVTQNVSLGSDEVVYISTTKNKMFFDDFVNENKEEINNFYFCRTNDMSKSSFYDIKAKKVIPCGSISPHDQAKAIKTYLEENKRNPVSVSEKAAKEANRQIGLNRGWVETHYSNVASLQKFEEFIKQKGLECNEKTKTGWRRIDDFHYEYIKDGKYSVCDVLGGSAVTFNRYTGLLVYIEYGNSLIPNSSTTQLMYIKELMNVERGDIPRVLKLATNRKDYIQPSKCEYYDPNKKRFFNAKNDEQAQQIVSQEQYVLDSKFIENILPKVSTIGEFKTLIAARGEEYNSETNFGWKIEEGRSVTRFVFVGYDSLSSLGITGCQFDKNGKFSIAEYLGKKDKGEYCYIRPVKEAIGKENLYKDIENLSDLYFCRGEQIENSIIYNSKTKETFPCAGISSEFIATTIKMHQKKVKTETKETATETKIVDIEWVKKYYSKIKTEKEFISFIKEKGEEYNEVTKTGWKLAFGYWQYYKNSLTANSPIIIDGLSFNKEGNLNFAESIREEQVSDLRTPNYYESKEIDPNWLIFWSDDGISAYHLITQETFKKKDRVMDELLSMIKDYTPTLKLKLGEFNPKNYTGIVEWENGIKEWLKEGFLHREDGPAVEQPDGEKRWYVEGFLQRKNGPAIERANGTKEWFKKAQRHREDGPAVEYANGTKCWYIEGKQYSEQQFNDEFLNKKQENRETSPAIDLSDKVAVTENNKLVQTIKSDAKEAAKRLAVLQISKFVQSLLVNSIKSKSSATKVKDLLESSNGRAVIKIMVGTSIPLLKTHLASKYESVLDEISEEFRIQGETDLVSSVVDSITSVFQSNFSSALETFGGNQSQMVRVDVPEQIGVSFKTEEGFSQENSEMFVAARQENMVASK